MQQPALETLGYTTRNGKRATGITEGMTRRMKSALCEPLEMRVNILGSEIGYDDTGQGTPVLLMHAFPLDRRMFAPQREALREAARLITFDVPGAGDSAPGSVSMDRISDIAAGLLDHLGVQQAVLGGVSMGGYAAFAFVRRHSERLCGLILANTRVAADTEEGKAARREMVAAAIEHGAAEVANRLIDKLLAETTQRERPAVTASVKAMIESTPPATIAALLKALADREDSTATLDRISVPTLVVAGEQDPLAPPEEMQAWAARIGPAKFKKIERAGHLACLEDSEAFNRLLRDFLREIR